MAKCTNKAPRNWPSCFFIPCFTVSVIPTINAPESFNNFIILSFLSSFEIKKVNLFPALTVPFPLIFLSNLFIIFDAELLSSPRRLSIARGIARSVIIFST